MMKNIHYVRICLIGVFLGSAFLSDGCSVFSPVRQGYENMVSYFNAYYNAKNLFNEAEDEIKAAAFSARGKDATTAQANQIPGTAKQKLGQVIDKCSNILAFHSTSSLVDNSLLLIGKSFFYQMEYLKAERKFIELLDQFPNSSLAIEAQLWLARSEERLGKLTDGIRLGEATVTAAHTSSASDLETEAHLLLGVLYNRMNDPDKSIAEYEKAIALSGDDYEKGHAQIDLGNIYFAQGQYKKAAEVYLKTEEYTSDIYWNYYSKLQAAIAYRESGEDAKGLALINAMLDDFRNREYLPAILYEQANAYAALGQRDDAITTYIRVDTAYARTEYSVRSAYQLELIFEKELGQYALALKYDSVVNAATGLDIVPEGRRKFVAFNHYFDAWRRLNKADSLFLVLSDTANTNPSDSLPGGTVDSTLRKFGRSDSIVSVSRVDSLNTKSTAPDTIERKPVQIADKPLQTSVDSRRARALDTLQKRAGIVDTVARTPIVDTLLAQKSPADTSHMQSVPLKPRPVLPNPDTLHLIKSIAAQELGDIFYSEIIVPDSAFYWYNKSLLWRSDSIRTPRILYILAELSRTNPDKKYPAPEEYYTRLDHEFPQSMYADEARRFLQKSSAVEKTDTAAESYVQAEKQIDAKEYDKAIATLQSLVQSFPKSPYAARSEYAIGWILEHRLGQPEKARTQYKRVIKNHEGTVFGHAASRRILDIQKSDTVKSDTTRGRNLKQIQKPAGPDSLQRSPAGKIDSVKVNNPPQSRKPVLPDSVQRNAVGEIKDTVRQMPVPPKNDGDNKQRK